MPDDRDSFEGDDETSESGVAGIGPLPDRLTSDLPSQPLEADPPLGSDVSRVWRWARRAAMSLVAIPAIVLAALGFWVGPYFLDDWRMDQLVAAVALDWRDFGLERARMRLQYELDHRKVGLQVNDETCKMSREDGQSIVSCAWAVDLDLPFTSRVIPLRFSSRAAVMPDGDLR